MQRHQNSNPQPTNQKSNIILDWWDNLPKKAKIAWTSGIAAVVALLVGFGLWHHFSPTQQVKRINHANATILTKAPNDIQKRPTNFHRFDYSGKNTEIPDLSDLNSLRRQGLKDNDDMYLRGQISIPDYDVNVPIFEGLAPQTLAWGAGTSKPGQEMGKGNYSLQAHNYIKKLDGVDSYLINGWFFTNLQTRVAPAGAPESSARYNYFRIPNGTNVYTLNRDNVYTYQVEKHVVIDNVNAPNAGDVLSDKEVQQVGDHKTPILTLATCYIQNGITYPKERMVYIAKLVKVTPRKDFKDLHQVFHRNPNAYAAYNE